MGVELDHEYGRYRGWRGLWTLGDMAEVLNNAEQISNTTAPQWDYYPAYTLDQMYKVLEQVGKVKGWKKGVRCGCLYDNPSLCCHSKENYTCTWCVEGNPNRRKKTYDWQHHYLRLCEAVPLGKGDEVLKEILK